MIECFNCKSFISCLRSGQVRVVDDMELRCDFYERADEREMKKEIVLDGVHYRRLIDEEGDG